MLMQPSLAFMDAIQNDPLRQYVALLLYGEGADGSPTFKDRSSFSRTVTAFGTIENDTGVDVRGTPSILCGSDANYLTAAYGSEFSLAGQDCCFELWLKCTDATSLSTILSRRVGGSNNWSLDVFSGRLRFITYNGTNGTLRSQTSASITAGTPRHGCVIRQGSTWYTFLDGVPDGSGADGSFTESAADLFVGRSPETTNRYFRGSINWLRLTIGHQRYDTAGFTPPPVPLSVF